MVNKNILYVSIENVQFFSFVEDLNFQCMYQFIYCFKLTGHIS